MRNQRVLDMTVMAMFLTIIIIMSAVPQLGYISLPFLPGVGGTLIHIPVLVAGLYFGMRVGLVTGFFFGVSSWIVALTRAATPIEFVFRNPIVSVLPRIVFIFIGILLFKQLSKWIKNKTLNVTITAILSTIIHTLLVLALLAIFGPGAIAKAYEQSEASIGLVFDFVKYVLVFNMILETILAALLVTPIVVALRAFNNKYNMNTTVLEIND